MISCGTHGEGVSAIVCQHHLKARARVVGFVENSDDPDDLQAWCDACEDLFVRVQRRRRGLRRLLCPLQIAPLSQMSWP
jgi:hypothetical protein